jgi:hypothetical protein
LIVFLFVWKNIGYEIPPFILSRRLLIEQKKEVITLSGIDVDNIPVTFLRAIEHKGHFITKEPFQINTHEKVLQIHNSLHFFIAFFFSKIYFFLLLL